jgi:nitroreductase
MVVQDRAVLRQISQITVDYYEKIAGIFGNPVLQPVLPFFLGNRFENFGSLAKEFKALAEVAETGKDVILHNAPVLIIFHASQTAIFANVNANLGAQNAALMAHSLGVGAFYLGYVVTACENDSRIPKLLGIPKNHRIYAGLALGYPAVRFTNWIEKESPKIRWM